MSEETITVQKAIMTKCEKSFEKRLRNEIVF